MLGGGQHKHNTVFRPPYLHLHQPNPKLTAKHLRLFFSPTTRYSVSHPTIPTKKISGDLGGKSLLSYNIMAPLATNNTLSTTAKIEQQEISALQKALTSESVPLARRFRALFSLKHYASLQPPTSQTILAVHAIAAAFPSPSVLLKHELAYCLGQTKNLASVPFLRQVLEDREEDSMCRHEAAEALGALGDNESLEMLRCMRDDDREAKVVQETCEIAVARIEWEHSGTRKSERLRNRYDPM